MQLGLENRLVDTRDRVHLPYNRGYEIMNDNYQLMLMEYALTFHIQQHYGYWWSHIF